MNNEIKSMSLERGAHRRNDQMQCDEVENQADAYGLGALDPEEREAVDRHAETCVACRQLLDEATFAASAVALAAPLERAPMDLHARIRRQLADEGRPESWSREPQPFTGRAALAADPPTRAQPSRPRQRFWTWKPALAASFGLVLLVGSAGWIARLQMQVNQLQSRSQALQRGLADFEGQRAALMLLASDGTSRLPMQSTDSGTGVTGAVIWNRSQRKCSVFAAGLPPAASDQAYHLWLVGGDRSWDQGELNAGGRGTAEKTIDLSRYSEQASYQLVVSLQSRQVGGGEWHPVLRAWVGSQ